MITTTTITTTTTTTITNNDNMFSKNKNNHRLCDWGLQVPMRRGTADLPGSSPQSNLANLTVIIGLQLVVFVFASVNNYSYS